MLTDRNRTWVRAGFFAFAALVLGPLSLAQEPTVPERVKELVAKLQKASLDEAWKVADGMARLGDPAVPTIEEHLSDPSESVRIASARALLALKDVPRAAKALVAIVKDS